MFLAFLVISRKIYLQLKNKIKIYTVAFLMQKQQNSIEFKINRLNNYIMETREHQLNAEIMAST